MCGSVLIDLNVCGRVVIHLKACCERFLMCVWILMCVGVVVRPCCKPRNFDRISSLYEARRSAQSSSLLPYKEGISYQSPVALIP